MVGYRGIEGSPDWLNRISRQHSSMHTLNKKRVVVAMSGGVDSCVVAALLADEGFDVIGVTMRLYDAPFENAGRLSKSCCGIEEVEDARATCRIIGAKHYYLNFEREFERHVIDYFVSEYEAGRTPYPCLACNDRMKFDFLLKRARYLGADSVATGHYARIVGGADAPFVLARGLDATKDQSYALFNLSQGVLRSLMFPIGHFTKEETRSMAAQFGLPVANKTESQDICFIPSGKYRDFITPRMTAPKPGVVVDTSGKVLASHSGVHNFTVGQRKGVPGSESGNRPKYVRSVDANSGVVVVGHAEDLLVRTIRVSSINWISGNPPVDPDGITARLRYRGPEIGVQIDLPADGQLTVHTNEPVRAAAPGQAIVFYQEDLVLGGGIIEGTDSGSAQANGHGYAGRIGQLSISSQRSVPVESPSPALV